MKRSISKTALLLCMATSTLFSPVYSADDAKTYYNSGTAHYQKMDYEAAIKDLSVAIQLEPKAADAYFNRGLSYRRLHRMDEAIFDYTKAIELYQGHPGYYFERCNALILKNNFEGAVTDCSEAIRLSPDEADGYFLRGLAFMLKGNLEAALTDGMQALRIDPDYTNAKRLLLETLLKKEAVVQKIHALPLHKPVLEHKRIEMAGENVN